MPQIELPIFPSGSTAITSELAFGLLRHSGSHFTPLTATQYQLQTLKDQRQSTPKHIELKDLPPEQRIAQLRGGRKHFIDTIKLSGYRAETALVNLARETLTRSDDPRSLVRGLGYRPV